MNRTKIEWCDFSWNPITGCKRGCWYCYAMAMAKRFHRSFEPAFHEERLLDPWNYEKPSRIFVCSTADIFASWTDGDWRNQVLKSAWMCPVPHTFIFLTKSPELIPPIPFPEYFWIGTTVTNLDEDWKRVEAIKKVKAGVRFVSFEPLLGELPSGIRLKGLDWIIVGKLTGSRKANFDPNWALWILHRAKQLRIPIFMKNNLLPEFPKWNMFQEFPKPHPGGKED